MLLKKSGTLTPGSLSPTTIRVQPLHANIHRLKNSRERSTVGIDLGPLLTAIIPAITRITKDQAPESRDQRRYPEQESEPLHGEGRPGDLGEGGAKDGDQPNVGTKLVHDVHDPIRNLVHDERTAKDEGQGREGGPNVHESGDRWVSWEGPNR
jgi:hypothetical protein